MLKRIYVDNYRCLANFEFKPDRVNLIVGANGSGKSTFLDALQAVRNMLAGMSPGVALPPWSLAWWDLRVTQTQTFEFDLEDGSDLFTYRLRVAHPAPGGAPIVEEESLRCGGGPLLTFTKKQCTLVAEDGASQRFAFEGVFSPLSAGMGDNSRLARFRTLLQGISQYKLNPWAMAQQSITESRGLASDGRNFVDWLRSLAQSAPRAFAQWQEKVAVALPHIRAFQLQDLGSGTRLLTGTMAKPGDGEASIPFLSFSEGEKCLAVLYALAATRNVNLVLSVDEPDNFLSLREVQPVLKELIEPLDGVASQIFVVTHHPEAIDYLAADSTWLFERPTAEHVRVRRFTFDRIKGERASESVRDELL